jgi:hypothetical protein
MTRPEREIRTVGLMIGLYCRHQFGHHHLSLSAESAQRRSRGVPHAQPSDENPGTRTVRDICTGELGQGLLRSMGAAVHEFTAIHPDRELSSAPVQAQLFSVSGRLCTFEELSGNHECLKRLP